jgi:CelD/BcsL family acetyltransferase involved in cellulose biosynthesis
MNGRITIDAIADLPSLEALTQDWWDLWARSPSATPFQSPAWLLPWWRHFSPGALSSVAVRRGARLLGLGLFYIEEGASGGRLLPLGMSLSDHLDVLLDPDEGELAGAAVVSALLELGWSSWELEELAPGAAAFGLPCPPGCVENLAPQSACPVLTLDDRAHGLPGEIPSERRRKLGRAWRRAEARGPSHVTRADADPTEFLEQLFALHAARWQSRGEAGVLEADAVRSFQRSALPQLAAAGLTRLYLVSIAGQIAGAYYGLSHRDRAYGYLAGFDPAFAHESPGTLLVGHAISEAVREGAREFHFLRGRESYKYLWGARDRWNQRRSFQRRQAA